MRDRQVRQVTAVSRCVLQPEEMVSVCLQDDELGDSVEVTNSRTRVKYVMLNVISYFHQLLVSVLVFVGKMFICT